MNTNEIQNSLERIIQQYSLSFAAKLFIEESLEEDDLMLVFGLTQAIKAENKQYWGRELGKCWERIVIQLCRQTCDNFGTAIREGQDELCDLVVGLDAIDTKYRIGSGDSGTLKKFRQYATRLRQMGYNPVFLILRNDSLPQAINACRMGGWTLRVGSETYDYLRQATGFDLESWLKARSDRYNIRP
ncbi:MULTISPECIES: restriction endonuclease [Cyanophyceae]|uniref:restriction endonuclease n=1 Tax=Cyanophyceae TaxID=3028117 RepID=UPI0016879A81|nr:restriction endonuclease [Trichocoleus sp. FACHB-40]MBD2003723.1 restriction endonuclease [Trichocoleus sp. FACHB-40]